jgi:hypothetical protein
MRTENGSWRDESHGCAGWMREGGVGWMKGGEKGQEGGGGAFPALSRKVQCLERSNKWRDSGGPISVWAPTPHPLATEEARGRSSSLLRYLII